MSTDTMIVYEEGMAVFDLAEYPWVPTEQEIRRFRHWESDRFVCYAEIKDIKGGKVRLKSLAINHITL